MRILTMREAIEATGKLPVVVVREIGGRSVLDHADARVLSPVENPRDVWCVTESLSWVDDLQRWVGGEQRTISHIPTGLSMFKRKFDQKHAMAMVDVLNVFAPEYGIRWKGGRPATFADRERLFAWFQANETVNLTKLALLRRAIGDDR